MAEWVVPPVIVTQTPAASLFDLLEAPAPRPQKGCAHEREEKTRTIWPGETWERMTWTCTDCGRVRGRC